MKTTLHQLLTALCLLLLPSLPTIAQTNNPAPSKAELNITVGEKRLKFTPTKPFLEMRLSVFNNVGELVYGATSAEAELPYSMSTNNGDSLAPGLYSYSLTLKYSEEDQQLHTGHFIVEKSQDQIWLTANEGTTVSGAELNAVRSGGRTIAGLGKPDESPVKRDVSERGLVDNKGNPLAADQSDKKAVKQGKTALAGTLNQVAKFDTDGVTLINSAITESAGNVAIGATTHPSSGLHQEKSGDSSRIRLRSYGGLGILFGERANGSLATPSAVANGNQIFFFGAGGYDGAAFKNNATAGLRVIASQNWTPSATGSAITLETTANGSIINTERLRINHDGNVGIGTTAPTERLQVAGVIHSTTGGIKFPDGTTQITAATGGSGGTVTSITAGTGLSGGTITNAGTVAIANGGVGTAQLADSSVTNAKIVDVAGSKVTGLLPVLSIPAGSGSYIQNGPLPQMNSNFHIDGNGTAGGTLSGDTVNATSQYNLNGSRFLSIAGSENTFVGISSGTAITSGLRNTFIGHFAGFNQTTGNNNTFLGYGAGRENTSDYNTFIGYKSGDQNTTGVSNTFTGGDSGSNNSTGSYNSIFGDTAGLGTTSGGYNSFFGANAGRNNIVGSRNIMFGQNADFRASAATSTGATNGDENIFLGFQAGGAITRRNSTAIGTNAFVGCDDCMVLGSSAVTAFKVGIGTNTPSEKLHVIGKIKIEGVGNSLIFPDGSIQTTAGGGDITGVTAGTGLSGGGLNGDVTLNIANDGVGTAQIADNSVTNAKIVDVAGNKVTGSVASATLAYQATNAFQATNALNAINAVNFSGALAGDVTGTQSATTVEKLQNVTLPAPLVADNGKVLKYKNNGVDPITYEWVADNNSGGTVTSITAGTGLSGGTITNTGTVAIANGGVNTAQLADNSVTNGKIVDVAGTKITGLLPVLSIPGGSGSYIQNGPLPQINSNFNIDGNGTAGGTLSGTVVNAATQYNLNNNRILSIPGVANVFVGTSAGTNNTGSANSFVGDSAGNANTSGTNNSFVGQGAGFANTTGGFNAFIGAGAGAANTSSSFNAFIGAGAGRFNTSGASNAFVGYNAGNANTTGGSNAFFGATAGQANTDGSGNSFFGFNAGNVNTTGSDNSFFGKNTGSGASNLAKRNALMGSGADFYSVQIAPPVASAGDENLFMGYLAGGAATRRNSVAIGAYAFVGCDDCMVLGSSLVSAFKVGIGTNTPASKLDVAGGPVSLNGNMLQLRTGTDANHGMIYNATIDGTEFRGNAGFRWGRGAAGGTEVMRIDGAGNLGVNTASPLDKLHVAGDIRVGTGANGCVKDADATIIAGTCSSDLRFKHSVRPLTPMLNKVSQLRPVNFFWRASEFPAKHFGSTESFGLIAQEVETILPQLVVTDEKGFKAVNYSKLPLLTIQAVKELKIENDLLKQQNAQQQQMLNALQQRLLMVERALPRSKRKPRQR